MGADSEGDDLLPELDLDLKIGIAKLLHSRGDEAMFGVDDSLGQGLELQHVEERRRVDRDQSDGDQRRAGGRIVVVIGKEHGPRYFSADGDAAEWVAGEWVAADWAAEPSVAAGRA